MPGDNRREDMSGPAPGSVGKASDVGPPGIEERSQIPETGIDNYLLINQIENTLVSQLALFATNGRVE